MPPSLTPESPAKPPRRSTMFLAGAFLMIFGVAGLTAAFLLAYGDAPWREALVRFGMPAGLLLALFGAAGMLIGGWLESRALDDQADG